MTKSRKEKIVNLTRVILFIIKICCRFNGNNIVLKYLYIELKIWQ